MRDTIRIGAVNYLNSKPLIEGLEQCDAEIELTLAHPSQVADQLTAGFLEVGLVPVVEYFRGDRYGLVPGIAIASYGPVLSVTLFSRVPWKQIRSVSLDDGSRTSAALTKVLLAEKYGVANLKFDQLSIDAPVDDLESDAVLLIGDRAMQACLPGYKYAFDLGQEWTEWTGLPFVFAVWAVRSEVSTERVMEPLRQAKETGRARVGYIAEREAKILGLGAGYCRRYLTNIIHYDLGPAELAGMKRYRDLAAKLGLAPKARPAQTLISTF